MSDLLAELEQAERANTYRPKGTCKLCNALERMETEVSDVLQRMVSGGTIGNEKLAAILAKNGYPVGRRAIIRHQQEGHTP